VDVVSAGIERVCRCKLDGHQYLSFIPYARGDTYFEELVLLAIVHIAIRALLQAMAGAYHGLVELKGFDGHISHYQNNLSVESGPKWEVTTLQGRKCRIGPYDRPHSAIRASY
jgi:hypothetical protein